jgi:hypothetical protein
MKLEARLEKLESQKQEIQKEIETLRHLRREEIANALGKMDLKETDTFTVVGCVLWCLEKDHDTKVLEEWRHAGRKFCASLRPKNTKSALVSSQKKAA